MNKSLHILLAMSFLTVFATAGGDINPVEPQIDITMDNDESTLMDNANFYAGLGYTRVRFVEEVGKDHSDRGYTLQAGYDFNPYIGLEARYTQSSAKQSETYTLSGDLDNLAIYLKPMLPVMSDVSLYALLGYGESTVATTAGDVSESGFQWGLGAKYSMMEHLSLFWDYTQFYKGDGFKRATSNGDVTLQSINVGLNYIY